MSGDSLFTTAQNNFASTPYSVKRLLCSTRSPRFRWIHCWSLLRLLLKSSRFTADSMINRFLYMDCQNARDQPQPEIKKKSMFRQKCKNMKLVFMMMGQNWKNFEKPHTHTYFRCTFLWFPFFWVKQCRVVKKQWWALTLFFGNCIWLAQAFIDFQHQCINFQGLARRMCSSALLLCTFGHFCFPWAQQTTWNKKNLFNPLGAKWCVNLKRFWYSLKRCRVYEIWPPKKIYVCFGAQCYRWSEKKIPGPNFSSQFFIADSWPHDRRTAHVTHLFRCERTPNLRNLFPKQWTNLS